MHFARSTAALASVNGLFNYPQYSIQPSSKRKRKTEANHSEHRCYRHFKFIPYKPKLFNEITKSTKKRKRRQRKGESTQKWKSIRRSQGKKGKKMTEVSCSSSSEEVWLSLTENDEDDYDLCMHCNQIVNDAPSRDALPICKQFPHDSCTGFNPDGEDGIFCDFRKEPTSQTK